MLTGVPAADRMLHCLSLCHTSPTILFLLNLRESTLVRTEAGAMLLDMCKELDVNPAQPRAFFRAVQQRVFAVAPVCPDFFAVSRRKDDAVAEFREELHRRLRRARAPSDHSRFDYMGAFMPFCFQCLKSKPPSASKAASSSLFFCYAAPEDAIRQMHDIMRAGCYRHDDVLFYFTQVYEHRLGVSLRSPDPAPDNRLAYIMLDWEVYEGRLGGRLSHEEAAQLCLSFPAWFCARLFERGFVDGDRSVTAVLKQKSRPVDGPDLFKHSVHVVVECCGVPAAELAALCADIFRPYRADIEECQRSRTFDSLPDAVLRSPWIGADLATMNGKTAFAVLFSKKSRADPGAQLVHRAAYNTCGLVAPSAGPPNPIPFAPAVPHDLSPQAGTPQLSREQAVWLLLQACFTVPTAYTCPLSLKAEALAMTRNQQNRTVARHHAVSEGGGPPPPLESSALPAWIKSVLDRTPGYRLRHDAAASYFKNIQGHVQDLCSWAAVHVGQGAMPCPVSLSMDPPAAHAHRSNGVIIVFDPCSDESVYVRCTSCRMGNRVNAHTSLVVDAAGRATNWMRLDEASLSALLEAARSRSRGTLLEAARSGAVHTHAHTHTRKQTVSPAHPAPTQVHAHAAEHMGAAGGTPFPVGGCGYLALLGHRSGPCLYTP
jgi:hypothetical protein